jgi:hypothetical protein
MLCDSCKNKCICKHYEYFNNILLDITVQVTNCELYSNKQEQRPIVNPDKRPLYRQPLPNLEPIKEESVEDEEEKIVVNIEDYSNEPQSASIIDLVMKGDKKHD